MFRRFPLIGFQKITAKDIAIANGIEYVPDVTNREINSNDKHAHMFRAINNRYILLYPVNTGVTAYPFEWYGVFYGQSQLIMNNQSSFNCITNLKDIIFQIIKLFEKYINKNVFISTDGFAIRLDGKLCPNYYGKASLVLTKDAICNDKVKFKETTEAKIYFINDFLDHYLGCNFGKVITSNPDLEEALISFNNLVIKKGLRHYSDFGFDIKESEDVMPYEFNNL